MTTTTTRPNLRPVPLASVWPVRPGRCYCTMAPDQWDQLLAEAYAAGWTLLVIGGDDETPVAAYQRPQPHECN